MAYWLSQKCVSNMTKFCLIQTPFAMLHSHVTHMQQTCNPHFGLCVCAFFVCAISIHNFYFCPNICFFSTKSPTAYLKKACPIQEVLLCRYHFATYMYPPLGHFVCTYFLCCRHQSTTFILVQIYVFYHPKYFCIC
jgi:hypothetical protein